MKKVFFSLIIVLTFSSMASSQITGRDYPPGRSEIESARAERNREIQEHNDWPRRPQLSPFLFGPKNRYGRLNAKFTLNNDSDKKIKQVTWRVTLVHLDTKQVIASYTVVTDKLIAPHREATLKRKLWVPLGSFYGPKVVNANASVKPVLDLPDEVQAEQLNEVKEIRYADGSVVKP